MSEKKGTSFWKIFWASFTALMVIGIIKIMMVLITVSAVTPNEFVIKKNTVLHMSLNDEIGDVTYAAFNPSALQLNQKFGLYDILNGIEVAKKDANIKGIFIDAANISAGMATIKEIRDALEDFQNSGKFIVAYNENYTKKSYYLSSVAKEVYVFPSGMFDFLGLGVESMFLKGALEKLDVEMQIIRGSNNKFKSAVEPLMYTQMSDANREQTQKYLDALWGEMLLSIENSRGVSIDKLNEIADSAYIRKSSQAVDYKLADAVKYYDEIIELLKTKAGENDEGELELLSFKKYALLKSKMPKAEDELLGKKGNVAVVFAEGEIVDGNGQVGQIGGNSMAKLIREAREDDKIKALVLRVNSPGGSALASDIIWREIILTKAVKPVVVSMGDVAASGGYYIACAADKIYAEPNTITGSIGVFGIIPYTGKMLENKLGITVDRVQTNQHSVLSMNKKLTPEEFKIIQQGVDDIYLDFITKVADGRGMKTAMVDSIGQGRVWAGTDAINIGLVDEFGGLNTAISDAADRAGIEKEKIQVQVYTTAKTNEFVQLMNKFEEQTAANVSVKSELEHKLTEMYSYVRLIESNKGIQARLPYLFWIE